MLLAHDDPPCPASQIELGMEQTDSSAADDDDRLSGVHPAMTAMPVEDTGERFRQGQPGSWHFGSHRDDIAATNGSGRHTQPRCEPAVDAVTDELAAAA